jgi:hypothetical protein
MSIRAHCIKKYICEYSQNGAGFANQADELLKMLDEIGVFVWTADDFNSRCDWEIRGSKDEDDDCVDGQFYALRDYINELKTLNLDEPNKFFKSGDITNKEVLETFEDWLTCIDPVDQVIRIEWF